MRGWRKLIDELEEGGRLSRSGIRLLDGRDPFEGVNNGHVRCHLCRVHRVLAEADISTELGHKYEQKPYGTLPQNLVSCDCAYHLVQGCHNGAERRSTRP